MVNIFINHLLDLDKTKNPKPTTIPDFMNIKSNDAFKTFHNFAKRNVKATS